MLYEVSEEDDPDRQFVRVKETHVGKGVFATMRYPVSAIIGEIKGQINEETDEGSEYTFDFENGMQLEPFAPFRYVNHSCDPNCEFEVVEISDGPGKKNRKALLLSAIRPIHDGDEITISYNWPATFAIECHCGSTECIGWIVCETEIELLKNKYDNDFERVPEFIGN